MLINIDQNLSPDILKTLREMGLGDNVLICDINFIGINFSISEESYILPDFFSLNIEKITPNINPIIKLNKAIFVLLGEIRFFNNVGLVINSQGSS